MSGDEIDVQIDTEGIAELLRSPGMAAMVNKAAQDIADAVGPSAMVAKYTTDRRAAAVTVPKREQVEDGVLTRAASSLGLTVVAKGDA